MKRLNPFLRYVVGLACAYEVVALLSPLPTITALTHANRHRAAVKCVVVGCLAYLGWHLLLEEAERAWILAYNDGDALQTLSHPTVLVPVLSS